MGLLLRRATQHQQRYSIWFLITKLKCYRVKCVSLKELKHSSTTLLKTDSYGHTYNKAESVIK